MVKSGSVEGELLKALKAGQGNINTALAIGLRQCEQDLVIDRVRRYRTTDRIQPFLPVVKTQPNEVGVGEWFGGSCGNETLHFI